MGSNANVIAVVCACGKRLKAPASAAGKRARCPVCGKEHRLPSSEESQTTAARAAVPQPQMIGAIADIATPPAALATPERPPTDDDPLGAMYDLAESATSAAPVPATAIVCCPRCRSSMNKNAVLCTKCGYNVQTGASITTTTSAAPISAGAPSKQAKKQIDYMAPTGSLVMGIVLSAVFALIASVIWIAIAYVTGLTIGYIAALIGAGAGIGMQAGHKGYSHVGGIIAGAMTVVVILIAKLIVLEAIMLHNNLHRSIFDLDPSKLGYYFFSPIGLIIMAVGVAAAYKTANGSSSS